ncbi:MAG TPA: PPC domain-containing protein [Pirellulales bacterium]|nr:PPC domain-containing protein [Pirellulales bacterium]
MPTLRILLALLALCGAGPARAELPSIRLDRIQPLGAAAGSTVELEVTAADAEGEEQLWFDHPGIKAQRLKPGHFQVTIAADVPEGTYDVRLLGRFGVSSPRLFAVATGLVDLAEKEPNNVPAEAGAVPINVAVAGSSDNNGQDYFRFTAGQGQRLTFDCQATRLDSELDASLTVVDAGGAIVASNADYRGRDPTIDFISRADGEYFVEIHDLSYRGGYPYRLLITDRPYVENVFPRAVEHGKPVELTALGYNFGSAGRPSPWQIDGRPLEEYRFTVTPATRAEAPGTFRFLEHPTGHSVLPTAATCTLAGFQVRVPLAPASSPAATLVFAEGPVTLEREPNNEAKMPQPLVLPATVSGRFDAPRDADWFAFTADDDGSYEIQVFSERIAGQADPYVALVDEGDNRLQELDDFGQRVAAFDGHLRDPVGMVNLAKGKTYRLLVQDRYGRGGARYQYVLSLRRARPDFFAAAIHGANPGPAGINVRQGGATYLDVVIHRQGGYGEPITITAEGLPPGLHAAPVTVPSDTRVPFVLWADVDAPANSAVARLVATGAQGETTLRREVRPYTRVWSVANVSSSRPTRDLVVAVRETAPYMVRIVPERASVMVGGKLEFKLEASRHWPDFTAPIRVIGLSLPGGFNLAEAEIPEGKSEGTCVVQVGNMRPGDYTLTLLAQAQVPFNKDPAAKERPNTLVSMPSQPVTITVLPEQKK